ncbi:CRISPR-associated exonuclease Cas4 [Naumannella cuiyingiana]|uniref:CRISPR-associated exonuclease Cas4 n=1 Tax=Naumannella cuiyingiana TaxID=1347891 RepID=A0A7Z0IK11_9ACTN|nr:CRISPR-associated protein Cas4 [Naumannella cuiyingiana]NYI70144.1 CRISPR-associated exonuclease Cas4 [Naumannella cuiyingiana]
MQIPDDWLRLSLLQHYAYCPTQASLILDGTWLDNHLTVEGDTAHERVDQPGFDQRRGVRVHHRVQLHSDALRIHGIADAIEEDVDGRLMPVEHKRGRGAGDLWPTTVQVVAQALCLAEMIGQPVPEAAIFVVRERRREYVDVATHSGRVIELVTEARRRLRVGAIPGVYERLRCKSCSLQNSCQPRGVQWR